MPSTSTDWPAQLPGPDWHKFHRGYEAVGRGDDEGVLRFLDPEIEWDVSYAFPDGPVYVGHAGVRRFFAEARKLWDGFELGIEELHEYGEHVVVIGWWSGTGKASGVPIRAPGAWVYRMLNGRATHMRFFHSREAALNSI